MDSIPTAPNPAPIKNRINRSAELYIRGLLTDVIAGSRDKVEQRHFIAFTARATARRDGLATFKAFDFNSAVVPSIDMDPAVIRHRFIRHRAGVSPALA